MTAAAQRDFSSLHGRKVVVTVEQYGPRSQYTPCVNCERHCAWGMHRQQATDTACNMCPCAQYEVDREAGVHTTVRTTKWLTPDDVQITDLEEIAELERRLAAMEG
jgi:hypothetical protein